MAFLQKWCNKLKFDIIKTVSLKMSLTCGLCGKENFFIGEKGVCCVCCYLLNNCSTDANKEDFRPIKEDICLMVRGLSSNILDAS